MWKDTYIKYIHFIIFLIIARGIDILTLKF